MRILVQLCTLLIDISGHNTDPELTPEAMKTKREGMNIAAIIVSNRCEDHIESERT